jgi:hypothetical protein
VADGLRRDPIDGDPDAISHRTIISGCSSSRHLDWIARKPFGENVEGLSLSRGASVMATPGAPAAGIHNKMFSHVNLLAGTGESP